MSKARLKLELTVPWFLGQHLNHSTKVDQAIVLHTKLKLSLRSA